MLEILNVVTGNVISEQYTNDGSLLQYLYVSNVKMDEDETYKPVVIESNEDKVELTGIKLMFVKPIPSKDPSVPMEYEKVDMGDTIDLLAIKINPDTFIEDLNTKVSPNSKSSIFNPDYAAYAIFTTVLIDSIDYRVLSINVNDDKTIDAIYVIKKDEFNITGIEDALENESMKTKEFLDFFKLLYTTDDAIESQAFKIIYDDKNIDSVVATAVFVNSISGYGIPVITLKEYNDNLEKYKNRKGLYIAGIGGVIPDAVFVDPSLVVTYSTPTKSMTASFISLVDETVKMSQSKSNPKPLPVAYLSSVMDKLLDEEASRFDTEIIALKSLLLMSGGKRTIHAINEFLKVYSSDKLDPSMISKMFADSLGSFYSNAIKKVDSIYHNINAANINITPVNFLDIEHDVVEMMCSSYIEESMDEYIRLNPKKPIVLVNRSISENSVLTYEILFSSITHLIPDNREEIFGHLAETIRDRLVYNLTYDATKNTTFTTTYDEVLPSASIVVDLKEVFCFIS